MLKGKRVVVCILGAEVFYGKVANQANKEPGLMLTEVTSGQGENDPQKPHSDCFIPWTQVVGTVDVIKKK